MNIANQRNEEEKQESKILAFLDSRAIFMYRFFIGITGIFLPSFAILILGYEVYDIVGHVISEKGTLKPEHIFMALILSTTAVAFIGMHRAVHKLIPEVKGENDTVKGEIPFFFTLIANAILLAGLLIVYNKYLPDKNDVNDKSYHAPCCQEKLNANKH